MNRRLTMVWIGVAVLAALLTGCNLVTRYERFYQASEHQVFPPASSARLCRYSEEARGKAHERGAKFLGVSKFCSRYTRPTHAVRCAKKIGANLVLVGIDYRETESGVATVPVYHPGETTTTTKTTDGSATESGTGRASIYGLNGYTGLSLYDNSRATYTETTTTQTQHPGHTTYHSVPYTIHYYDHTAYFFRDPTLPGLAAP